MFAFQCRVRGEINILLIKQMLQPEVVAYCSMLMLTWTFISTAGTFYWVILNVLLNLFCAVAPLSLYCEKTGFAFFLFMRKSMAKGIFGEGSRTSQELKWVLHGWEQAAAYSFWASVCKKVGWDSGFSSDEGARWKMEAWGWNNGWMGIQEHGTACGAKSGHNWNHEAGYWWVENLLQKELGKDKSTSHPAAYALSPVGAAALSGTTRGKGDRRWELWSGTVSMDSHNPVQCALGWPWLNQMTNCGPFQPYPFCDSVM